MARWHDAKSGGVQARWCQPWVSDGGFCCSSSSRTISSHSARHSLHIRVVPADAIAATRLRGFAQKLHCPAPGSPPTAWIPAIGVPTTWPGAASTVCTWRRQPSQMYALGPAISFLTCFWLFPQNEHDRWFPVWGTRPLYLGRTGAQPSDPQSVSAVPPTCSYNR